MEQEQVYKYDAQKHELEISGKSITALDMERIQLLNFPVVYHINIHDTSITELPNIVDYQLIMPKMNNVTSIAVVNSNLTNINVQFVCAFSRLKTLDLHNNQITEISDDFLYSDNTRNIEILNLSHNELKAIPEVFERLQFLIYIDFSYNKLTKLPKSLAYYTGLNRNIIIILNNNLFREIPIFLLKPQKNINPKLIRFVHDMANNNMMRKFKTTILPKILHSLALIPNSILGYMLYNHMIHINNMHLTYNDITPDDIEDLSIFSLPIILQLMAHIGIEVYGDDIMHHYNRNYGLTHNLFLNELIRQYEIAPYLNRASFNPHGSAQYTVLDIAAFPVKLFMYDNPLPELMYTINQPYTAEDYDVLVKYTIQSQNDARDQDAILRHSTLSYIRGHSNASGHQPFARMNMNQINDVYSFLKEPGAPPASSNYARSEYKRLKSEGSIGGRRRRQQHRRTKHRRRRRTMRRRIGHTRSHRRM